MQDLVAKASIFPQQCTLQELEDALVLARNNIQYYNIYNAIQQRHGLVNIPSRRMQLQKPRYRVVAGRAPWPVS